MLDRIKLPWVVHVLLLSLLQDTDDAGQLVNDHRLDDVKAELGKCRDVTIECIARGPNCYGLWCRVWGGTRYLHEGLFVYLVQ